MQASYSFPGIPFPHISTFNNILLGFFFFDALVGTGGIVILIMEIVMNLNMMFLVG